MICRYWKGLFRADRADDYVRHLREGTFKKLERLDGFLGGSILKRTVAGGVEFVVLTRWNSLAAIQAFAGEDIERAVIPDELSSMIIEYDARVCHYEEVAPR
jgi:heme-degrading monooxygenase HmoA